MKKVSDKTLLNHYIEKHRIDNIFSQSLLDHAHLAFYKKDESGSLSEKLYTTIMVKNSLNH
ncbi:MAG TPA: hypothetical protein VM577_16830 [Anaerovoracaceae bacterium]|nr:hypothetical protein [Anaerovoracaceae bacterium]